MEHLELNQPSNSLFRSWPSMSKEERGHAFGHLSRHDAEEIFLNLDAAGQAELYLGIPVIDRRSWIRLLAPDDAVDLLQELDAEERIEALALLDHQTRSEVVGLLAYAEDAAGGLMNSRFARLRPEMTGEEAIKYLRAQTTNVETIYYAYVLGSEQKLLGVVSLRQLFMAPPEKTVSEIMRRDLVTVPEEMDQEQIGYLFSQKALAAIPVVDAQGRMMGVVTIDDIIHVVQEEATEDIQKIGGTVALESPYLETNILQMIKKRAGWLMILFVGEMFTATAMGFYEHEIERAVVLALFIPLIISSGGNSGSQASTLIIRAMALGQVRLRNWWQVLWREIFSGIVLGVILGTIGLTRILLWPARKSLYGEHYVLVGAAVSCSILGVVLWGTLMGSMLPFVLRRLGFDPATASAPLVATLVDVTGIVIYFTAAHLILRGVML